MIHLPLKPAARWQQLPPRDLLALLVLAIAAAAWLLYVCAWMPLRDANRSLQSANTATSAALLRMRAQVEQYRKLQTYRGESRDDVDDRTNAQSDLSSDASSGPASDVRTSAPLSQLIEGSLQEYQLQLALFQPGTANDAQVRLDAMPFDGVLRWLHAMELSGAVTIRELAITPAPASDRVNVSARLASRQP